MAAYLLRTLQEDAAWEDNMVMRNTMPGDEVIITTNGETMACKVVKVMGKDGTFEEPTVPKGQLGDMHVKITINKEKLLHDLGEINKAASIARDKLLEELRGLFPCWPIGSINDIRLKQMERPCSLCHTVSRPIRTISLEPGGSLDVRGVIEIISWEISGDGSSVVSYR